MSTVIDEVEFDSDAFDVAVVADRLPADQFRIGEVAELFGVTVIALKKRMEAGTFPPPHHVDDDPKSPAGIWTAGQLAPIIAAGRARDQRLSQDGPAPCGTYRAWAAHRRRKEKPDILCRLAANRYRRELYRARKEAAA